MPAPNRLKELRTRSGFSVAQLADKTGIKGSSISFQENGKRAITVESAFIYCDLFGCTLDYLFCREPAQSPLSRYTNQEIDDFMAILKEEQNNRQGK